MKLKFFIIFSIFLLAFILRIYKLGEIPSGFYNDESLYGYEAYSILKTGKDQYGNRFPVVFKAFGDFRPGLNIYATVPFIAVGGLTEFSTRLPSAVFSALTAIIIFFLSYELWNNFYAAASASLLFSLSGWSLQFARMSHETNLATFLVASAIYLFIKGLKNGRYMILSFVVFSVSVYAYYTTRVFVPLWLVTALFFCRSRIYPKIKYAILGLVLMTVLSLPLLKVMTDKEMGWSRVDSISLWGDPGIILGINVSRGEDKITASPMSIVFHNKLLDGVVAFSKSFLSHFDPKFLFLQGDPQELYQTPNIGIVFLTEFIFVVIALDKLRKRRDPYIFILLSWAIIGLLPDSLTRLYPAAPRIHLVLPLVSLLGGYGIQTVLVKYKGKYDYRFKLLIGVFILMTVFQLSYFLHQNFIHVPVRYAKEWHYGLKEVAYEIKAREDKYDKIWISRDAREWINYLFYFRYPPEKIQKEIKLSEKNEFGLGSVYTFSKYIFDDIPWNMAYMKNTLFVGKPTNFRDLVKKPLYTIYYPDNEPAFYIVDQSSFINEN